MTEPSTWLPKNRNRGQRQEQSMNVVKPVGWDHLLSSSAGRFAAAVLAAGCLATDSRAQGPGFGGLLPDDPPGSAAPPSPPTPRVGRPVPTPPPPAVPRTPPTIPEGQSMVITLGGAELQEFRNRSFGGQYVAQVHRDGLGRVIAVRFQEAAEEGRAIGSTPEDTNEAAAIRCGPVSDWVPVNDLRLFRDLDGWLRYWHTRQISLTKSRDLGLINAAEADQALAEANQQLAYYQRHKDNAAARLHAIQ
jgi:hypothetical protein